LTKECCQNPGFRVCDVFIRMHIPSFVTPPPLFAYVVALLLWFARPESIVAREGQQIGVLMKKFVKFNA
tara:strand:+ start:168 stop:374 length:207 start_codon:yes stop_codon:yes gene_type:complete